jgi:HAD superfamily hydrolase (TIGR01509 family)
MIKGVLFDMDGVLIEAKEWHYVAFNRALELFGMTISRYDHETVFDGLPTRRKLEMLHVERGLPREMFDFLNEMKQRYTVEIVHTRCKPCFAQERALSRLKALGYHTAVCSNSIRATVELMMNQANLAPYLDLMVSNEDVDRAKPAPDMYLKAMRHFKLQPHECLVLEDNENGIKAARASGAHVLEIREVGDTNITRILERVRQIDETEPAALQA